MKSSGSLSFVAVVAASLAFGSSFQVRAADHRDGPKVASDVGADIADVFFFLDPNDNDMAVLIGTFKGFIVPGENNNDTALDSTARFTFAIENTGDASADLFIDTQFSRRTVKAGAATPSQDASVTFRGVVPSNLAGAGGKFTEAAGETPGPIRVTPVPTLTTPNSPIINNLANAKNPTPNIQFVAGIFDDPFCFDIPGFNRFVASVITPPLDPTRLDRSRDTFAGYNTLAIAVRLPATLLRNAKPKRGATASTKLGVTFITARGSERTVKGEAVSSGAFLQVDRQGFPGINVVLIPFNRKNEYNGSSTLDDAKGKFLGDIAATLGALHTVPANIATLASLAGLPPGLAPTNKPAEFGTGDFLRLETDKTLAPNSGPGGGSGVQFEDSTPANPARGFPNGRRLRDDVIDTLLFVVSNGAITAGDHVDASDVATQDTFPFLAPAQQPREGPGNVDDNTRN
jgi:hypothetical protein